MEAAVCGVVSMSELVNIYSSWFVMTTATILYVSGGVSFTLLASHRALCLTHKGFCNSLLQDNAWDNVTYAVIIRDQWTGVISAWKNKNMFLGTGHLWLVLADTTHMRTDISKYQTPRVCLCEQQYATVFKLK